METYIRWSFWLGIISLVIQMIRMSVASYPRNEEITLGADIVRLVACMFFAAWAGLLLYR